MGIEPSISRIVAYHPNYEAMTGRRKLEINRQYTACLLLAAVLVAPRIDYLLNKFKTSHCLLNCLSVYLEELQHIFGIKE